MKYSKITSSWMIAIFAALFVGGAIYHGLQTPLTIVQETVVTSTTKVVVVPIPGFPVESIVLGALLGLTVLVLIRRWKLGDNRKQHVLAAG